MSPDEVRALIQEYLDLVTEGCESTEAGEGALIEILDRLAVAVHRSSPGDVTDDRDAPRQDYKSMRALATERFPNYGLYGAGRLLETGKEDELLVGDAIDDITDIALDLHEAAWTWDNIGPEDGLWVFRFGFDSHWGQHLRELQAYLHLEHRQR